jgi:CRP-like cAMP-binding protein
METAMASTDERGHVKQSHPKFDLLPPPRFGPGFRGLTKNSIRKILESASLRTYSPQHWLYRQGDPARNFFILKSGLVSLSELNSSGEESLIRFILPGEPTGCVALSEIQEHVLSAQVLEPTVALVWDREAALELIQEIPKAAANLLSNMVSDLVHYYHRVHRLRTDPLRKRIEWALSELSRVFGKSTPEGLAIDYRQRQLAALAGSTIYGVSRELGKLERRGVLRKQRGRILLLNAKRLPV